MKINYDGKGEHEIICSVGTLSLYEQEFGSSMVADVYGKIELGDSSVDMVTAEFVASKLEAANGKPLPKTTQKLIDEAFPTVVNTTIDYTKDNWEAYTRALWAMLKTAEYVNNTSHIPGYKTWAFSVTNLNLTELSDIVINQCQEVLFRSGVTTISK